MDLKKEVLTGLKEPRKYVPQILEWGTEEGQILFQARRSVVKPNVPREEVQLIEQAADEITATYKKSLTVVEIAAGVSDKTPRFLGKLLADGTRHVQYIPMDMNEEISYLPEKLTTNYPERLVVHPIIGDILFSKAPWQHLEKILQKNVWPILFFMIGPSTIGFSWDEVLYINKMVATFLHEHDVGFIDTYGMAGEAMRIRSLSTYLEPQLPNFLTRYVNLYLRRVNEVLDTDIAFEKFQPEVKFEPGKPVAGGRGHLNAVCFYAKSVEDQVIHLNAYGIDIHFDKEERLALFKGEGHRLHYGKDEIYLLAQLAGMHIKAIQMKCHYGLSWMTIKQNK